MFLRGIIPGRGFFLVANKYPWFTHDHDANEDEFIQQAMDRFGHFGYSAYFITLELLHKHGVGDKLSMKASRYCSRMRSRKDLVKVWLTFAERFGKLSWDQSGDLLNIEIKKFRERQGKTKSNLPSSFLQTSVKPPIHIEEHIEEHKERKIHSRFHPPTPEEIKAYCLERKNQVDPGSWMDYYQANGWKVGKNPMKDWRAAIRTWERKSFSSGGTNGTRANPNLIPHD